MQDRSRYPINRETYGERHPDVATGLNNLGGAWEALGEYQKAIGLFEQALVILIERQGPDHPRSELAAKNLAMLRQRISSENPIRERQNE